MRPVAAFVIDRPAGKPVTLSVDHLDRLGGADVFTLPNAWAMAETLRLDLNSLGPFGTTP